MISDALTILSALEFRMPMLLRNVEPLSETVMHWVPAPGRVSVAWQVWHIAEVEENWVGGLVLGEPLRFPFGVKVREAREDQYPDKARLLAYLHEVRALTRARLERLEPEDLDRTVDDPDFGSISVRDVWGGVVTSFAWHAGQVAMTAKLIPDSPVTTMRFRHWKGPAG